MKVKSELRFWVYEDNGEFNLCSFYDSGSVFGVCMTPEKEPYVLELEVEFDERSGRNNALKVFDEKIAEALQNVEVAKSCKQKFLAISAE